MEWTEEVYERLCALCASWRSTAPLTAGSIVARSAPNVHLDIYLVTVMTNEGLEELRTITIPSVIQLLTTILQTILPGTMRSMETENPERRDPLPRPAVNLPQFEGEWLHMGQPAMSVDAQA
uniref:Uncharacterized protein n=1 Tax=Moniliophthora roreri TaxID=221103 RepID=A0A0W0GEM0_MONRR